MGRAICPPARPSYWRPTARSTAPWRLAAGYAHGFVPLLFVTSDPNPRVRLACLESGADAYLARPLAPGELLAQLHALLRIKEAHDRLSEKAAEVHRINHRLQAAYQQLDS